MEAQKVELKNKKKKAGVIQLRKHDGTIKQLTLVMQNLEWRTRILNLEF